MSLRELPNFLTRGDAELAPSMPGLRDREGRMRAMMGMGRHDPLGSPLSEETRAWLRHVEAGRTLLGMVDADPKAALALIERMG